MPHPAGVYGPCNGGPEGVPAASLLRDTAAQRPAVNCARFIAAEARHVAGWIFRCRHLKGDRLGRGVLLGVCRSRRE